MYEANKQRMYDVKSKTAYDAKTKTAQTKKTSSYLGRVLHDDPVMAARKKQDDDRRNSPRGKLLEKHDAEVRAMQHDHVSFARTLADDHKIEESEMRRRSPNDEFPLERCSTNASRK